MTAQNDNDYIPTLPSDHDEDEDDYQYQYQYEDDSRKGHQASTSKLASSSSDPHANQSGSLSADNTHQHVHHGIQHDDDGHVNGHDDGTSEPSQSPSHTALTAPSSSPLSATTATTKAAMPYGFGMEDDEDADGDDNNHIANDSMEDVDVGIKENVVVGDGIETDQEDQARVLSPVSVDAHASDDGIDGDVDQGHYERRQQLLSDLSATDSIFEVTIIHTLREAMTQMQGPPKITPQDAIEYLSKNYSGISEYCNLLVDLIGDVNAPDTETLNIDVEGTMLRCMNELFLEYIHKNPAYIIDQYHHHQHQQQQHIDSEEMDMAAHTHIHSDTMKDVLSALGTLTADNENNTAATEWYDSIQQLGKQYPPFNDLLRSCNQPHTSNHVANNVLFISAGSLNKHEEQQSHDIVQDSYELCDILQQLFTLSISARDEYENHVQKLMIWLGGKDAGDSIDNESDMMVNDKQHTNRNSNSIQRVWILSYLLHQLMQGSNMQANTHPQHNSPVATALYDNLIERILNNSNTFEGDTKEQIIHVLLAPSLVSSSLSPRSSSYQARLHNTAEMIGICMNIIQQHNIEKSDKHSHMDIVNRIHKLYVSQSASSHSMSSGAPPLQLLRNKHTLEQLLIELIWNKNRLGSSAANNTIQLLSTAVSNNNNTSSNADITHLSSILRLIHDTCHSSIEKQLPHISLVILKQHIHIPIIAYYAIHWITYLFTTDDDIHDITMQLSYKHLLIYYITLLASILTQHNTRDIHETMLYTCMEIVIQYHVKRIQFESSSLAIQHMLLLYVHMMHLGVIVREVMRSLLDRILPQLDMSHIRYIHRQIDSPVSTSEEWSLLFSELQRNQYLKKAMLTAKGIGIGV